MSREFGGHSEAAMSFRVPEEPKEQRKISDVKFDGRIQRALEAARTRGNRALPELIQAVSDAVGAKDPVAMDMLDPDSQRNMKLPEEAKAALRNAWELNLKASQKSV